jgi:hypothetical protein
VAEPFAVVMTYAPSEGDPTRGDVMYTPFQGGKDPLSDAHRFAASEEARGDFPGSYWTVTGNDEAAAIRSETLLRSIGITP